MREESLRIEVWNGAGRLLSIPLYTIPKGAQFRECYETQREIIVCGWPEMDDESHDCDAMGCSTLNHVLYRFRKGPS